MSGDHRPADVALKLTGQQMFGGNHPSAESAALGHLLLDRSILALVLRAAFPAPWRASCRIQRIGAGFSAIVLSSADSLGFT